MPKKRKRLGAATKKLHRVCVRFARTKSGKVACSEYVKMTPTEFKRHNNMYKNMRWALHFFTPPAVTRPE